MIQIPNVTKIPFEENFNNALRSCVKWRRDSINNNVILLRGCEFLLHFADELGLTEQEKKTIQDLQQRTKNSIYEIVDKKVIEPFINCELEKNFIANGDSVLQGANIGDIIVAANMNEGRTFIKLVMNDILAPILKDTRPNKGQAGKELKEKND